MTKEQKIQQLKALKQINDPFSQTAIALEAGIKALEQQSSDDCISRQAVLDLADTIQTDDYSGNEILEVVEVDDIKALPPVTPTHGTCKDCKYQGEQYQGNFYECDVHDGTYESTFYCADFEKRGNENGSN